MSDQKNSTGGRPTALFPGERRSAFAEYAQMLREEREKAEAEARMGAEPPAQPDGPIITSFGEAIPAAPAEKPKLVMMGPSGEAIPTAPAEKPKKSELKYSDHPDAPEWAKHPSQRKPPDPVPEEKPFRPEVEWFEELLWKDASDDVRVYCIMDGYWAKGLYGRLLASPDISWAHMFQGDVALRNIQDAPFIIALKRGHKLLRWLIEEGWGDGWGIYFTASTRNAVDRYGATKHLPPDMAPSNEERVKLCNLVEGMEDPLWLMRRHFRRFSDVEFEEDARVVDFRYYDPATLRTYLSSCNNYELLQFCGPIHSFYAEGYSEVKAANRPEHIYYFSALFDLDAAPKQRRPPHGPPMNFQSLRYDAKVNKTISLARLPASTGKPDRDPGLWAVIRTDQTQAFSVAQMEEFSQKIQLNMRELLVALHRHIEPKALESLVAKQLKLALHYKLSTESEIQAFSTCAIILGDGFDKQNKQAKIILEENMNLPTGNVDKQLQNIAKHYLNKAGK